ncbi:AsmA family protein [Halomonas nitroreducens]|uniref:AsmA family protein n=1 Tax=Halomonas nitroreducens TaxID=447425 RepID=A0A3S0JT35_9GAMM|nr:AsmA family protein [Halomonas nitroreducens]RTQ97566.1 AsmA family protein [Halomonas nitroreducens]
MKRILRTLLAAIGVLGLVVVGAVVFVTTFFDPEDLKPRLVDVVREHSGLELDLEGPLAWSFYPRLGVSVESAQARLPSQPTDDTPFAAFDHAEVSLAMAPLLRGKIAIDGLTLDGLALNLERDAEGRGNWEALIERLEERGEEAEAVLAPASAGPNPDDADGLAVALNIASVQVRDGRVNYRDAQAGRELAFEQVDISGSNVNPDSPFPLSASLQVAVENGAEAQAEDAVGLVSQVELETRVNLGLAESRHVLSNLKLDTTTRLSGGDEEETQEARLNAKELILDLAGGQIKSSGSQLEFSLLHPRLGEKRLPLTLAFQLDANLQQDTARLREMQLTGPDGLEASGNLAINELSQTPRYEGQLRLASLSLRPWLIRFQAMPTTASNKALSEVALASSVEGDLQGIALDDLTLSLDGGTFNGHMAGRFDGSRLDVDLKGDSLNLDDYLPPADGPPMTASQGAFIQSAVAQEQSGGLVPAEWLGDLALDAHLLLGQLTLMEQTFENVELTLQGRDGRHRLTAFESDFHDGHLAASGQLDVRETPLRWQLTPRVENVRLGSLLDSLSSDPAPLRGRLQGEGELETRGNSVAELKRALGGRLATRVAEGSIAGVNVSRELCTAAARLEGETPSREWREDTEFERAEASFRIRDGVAESDDLLVTIPGGALDGGGQLDLASEQFDLKAAARFTDSVDAACEVNPRLVDVPFPVRCEGQLGGDSSEWCRFDREAFQDTLAGLLRREASERAGEEVEKRLDDAVKELDERLGEGSGSELRDALEGLFK